MKRKIVNKVNYLRKKLLLKKVNYKNLCTGTIEKATITYIGTLIPTAKKIVIFINDGSTIEEHHLILNKKAMKNAKKEMANLRIFRNKQKIEGEMEYIRNLLNAIHEDEKLLATL